MKNKDLEILYQGINAVGNLSEKDTTKDLKSAYARGVKFAFAMVKNKRKIKSELEILQESIKPDAKFQDYDQKRVFVCEKFADKDKGRPKMENNQYIFSKESRVKFDKEMTKLNKDNKDLIDKRQKQLTEFNGLMDDESDFVPFQVKLEEVPGGITPNQMDGIYDLVIMGKEGK